ncbi:MULTISPECIES: M20/M25/M40 family metallo-hydrolase [Pseudonocardia]|uniref:Peptidase M20 n=2 Tax=Pseudonocardia TaxID=1847 RepID=A0ABQ0RRV8_9PSEU|nr:MULTISPECIES: M20/M25/M40 family metallo-hydrolase [Pseudonocardia]OSY43081.1 putative succinyl-diaminopimelate desuccinylase [Pseudonocardia autotrophica]TDN71569.1 acetylornithine deacetylase [Pseudonocardia autotrophica]BBG02259.1 peptidase M20 [Pseudonocardia autotrophica]GEC23406.1 peptidase M20 [Pseudonocardia saturnea]
MHDPVDLAGRLVALDTRGGGERAAADLLADLLDDGGFTIALTEPEPGRANLVARRGYGTPTTLTGHLDTVPADPAGWSFDPHAGDVVDGRLRGRGSTDMKAGVAAITVAALRSAPEVPLQLVFTFGEETGGDGARALTGLEPSPLLLVAEPTSNRVLHGHKGVLWLRLIAAGVSAHGSRPELGRNALVALARAAARLHDHDGWPVGSTHGPVTCNPGVLRAGTQPNLVPDHAELELDLRLVPGFDADAARAVVAGLAGDVRIDTMIDLPAIGTDPADPHAARAARELGHGGAEPEFASYFTDASVLARRLGGGERDCAVLVYGPGDPALAHVTDETCSAANIAAGTDALLRACAVAPG